MVKLQHCMILFEQLQKTEKTTNRFLKNPAKRPKLYMTTPPKTKFYWDVYLLSSKSDYSYFLDMYMKEYEQNGATTIGQSMVNLQTHMFIKQSKLVPKTEKQNNSFSKNPIKRPGICRCRYKICKNLGTFQKLKLKKHIKIQQIKILKIQKLKNPKIPKSVCAHVCM